MTTSDHWPVITQYRDDNWGCRDVVVALRVIWLQQNDGIGGHATPDQA